MPFRFVASSSLPTAWGEFVIHGFEDADNPPHGQQEGRFFNGYYDCYCYLSLHEFCGQQLPCAYLRPSRIDGARHAGAILKLLVTRLRLKWPQMRIDAGDEQRVAFLLPA